ncbi:MAG TPA: biotin/lipoyl-containing protein, partial [Chitinophagaceae bacterium]
MPIRVNAAEVCDSSTGRVEGNEDDSSNTAGYKIKIIMATVDLVMPKLGESIMEATILKWHKQPGDHVKMDETILEIATDKVDSEVPSTAEGVIDEILFKVNDVVPIGKVIARIKTAAAETAFSRPVVSTPAKETISQPAQEAVVVETIQPVTSNQRPATSNGSSNRFYSPLVLNIAASEGVSMSELENIPGTGNEGRVTKKDILQFVSQRRSGGLRSEVRSQNETMVIPMAKIEQQQSSSNQQITTYSGNVEIIEMDRMRKLIAEHMVRSKQTSPHVTSF